VTFLLRNGLWGKRMMVTNVSHGNRVASLARFHCVNFVTFAGLDGLPG
jgi:hypothetical protein